MYSKILFVLFCLWYWPWVRNKLLLLLLLYSNHWFYMPGYLMLNVNCGTPHKLARTRSWNECRYYVSLDTFTYMIGRQLWHAVHDCDVITKNWCATFSHHHLQSVISSMASSPWTMGRASCTLDLKEKFHICGVAVDLPSLQHSLQKQQCGPLPKQVVWALQ